MAAVSIAPEVIFNINGLKVTNSILATLLVDFVLISIIYKIRADLSPVPGKLQTIVESVISYFYSLTEQISGKFVDVIFPWFASFFIFIFASNIIGLLPGFGTIGFFQEEHGKEVFIPILRAVTSDFNATFAWP